MSRWPGKAKSQRTRFGGLSRSELMSRVCSRGNRTTEEKLILLLREAGIGGWRRHSLLFGRPDFVWRKARVAVFVDGCFWHGHACGRNLSPKTNVGAWREKIRHNKARDSCVTRYLRQHGWRVCRIWECSLSKHPCSCINRIEKALKEL